jgi:hypothetical protein
MRMRGEFLILLRVLRAATSSPVNWITCAIAIATFVIIATTPTPSLVYTGMKAQAEVMLLGFFLLPFFVLYVIARLIIAIFRRRREALFLGCALWALLMPIVIGLAAVSRHGDLSARHALVAKLYEKELKDRSSLDVHAARLIDLGEKCFPEHSAYECWIVVASKFEDSDIAEDIGGWHTIKSSTLLRLLPAYIQYGQVAVQRIDDRVYSVLGAGYPGP